MIHQHAGFAFFIMLLASITAVVSKFSGIDFDFGGGVFVGIYMHWYLWGREKSNG